MTLRRRFDSTFADFHAKKNKKFWTLPIIEGSQLRAERIGRDRASHFYLEDPVFSLVMGNAFNEENREYFQIFQHRKLQKDETGNLGMCLCSVETIGTEIYLSSGGVSLRLTELLSHLSTIGDHASLLDVLLQHGSILRFFAFLEGMYVFLYLSFRAGWSIDQAIDALSGHHDLMISRQVKSAMMKSGDRHFFERFYQVCEYAIENCEAA